jgi:hypothetical protein
MIALLMSEPTYKADAPWNISNSRYYSNTKLHLQYMRVFDIAFNLEVPITSTLGRDRVEIELYID